MKKTLFFMLAGLLLLACKPAVTPDDPTTKDESKDPQVVAEPPKVVSTSPASGATDVSPEGEIIISYDKEISLASKTTISVNGVYYDDAVYVQEKNLYIPYALAAGTPVAVKIAKPSVKDKDGNFADDFTLNFTIKEPDLPSDDPSGEPSGDASGEPSLDDFEAITIDFDDIKIGNWNAYKYIEPEQFTDILVGCSMSIYYKDALSGAQMALDTNVDGWPGIEDDEGNSYHINNIALGNSHFTLELDNTMVTTLKESGLIIGGQFFTVCYVTVFYGEDPGKDVEDEDESGDTSVDPSQLEEVSLWEDDVTPEWSESFVLLNDGSYFAKCVIGSTVTIYYKDVQEGAEMGLFKGDWTAIVDSEGNSYHQIFPEAPSGSYVLNVDKTILSALKAGGMIIGGTKYTVDRVVATVKK